PTPSTRPKDLYLVYNQPGHKKKPTNESFPTPPSPSRATKNSSYTTIPTTQAAAAATPQATKPANIAARPHGKRTRTRTTRSATSPSTVIDTTRPRAPLTSPTAVKKSAAANPAAQAQLQAKQKNIDAKPRNVKLSNATERNTPAATVAIDAANPWHALWTTANATATCIADEHGMHKELDYTVRFAAQMEAAVLERLEQQRRSTPPDLHALLAHPDPFSVLGERLYQLIECHDVALPGKITGMLLDGLPLDELHSLLVNVPPGDAAATIASWISTAQQVLREAAEGTAAFPCEALDLPTESTEHAATTVTKEPKEPEVPVPPEPEKPDRLAEPKEHVAPTVTEDPTTPTRELLRALDELVARKESKDLEERKSRERHEARL
ncbi:hypothetical protein Ctob_016388, partial [Chrysochromulina tobinii]